MTSAPAAPLLRALLAVLFCLTLTGAEDAAASTGPVVGWGDDLYGQATPPDASTAYRGPRPTSRRAAPTTVRSRRAPASSFAGA